MVIPSTSHRVPTIYLLLWLILVADVSGLGCEELPTEVLIPHGSNLDYFNTTKYVKYIPRTVQPDRRKSLAMS
jgi:hypothetical protein